MTTKTKRKSVKKKSPLTKTSVVAKLKKSAISKSAIARALKMKSHNSVSYWFKTGKMPFNKIKHAKKLLERA